MIYFQKNIEPRNFKINIIKLLIYHEKFQYM